MKRLVYILFLIVFYSCKHERFKITEFDSSRFSPNTVNRLKIDTIWKSSSQKELIIKFRGRGHEVRFLVINDKFYSINLLSDELDWAVDKDSIVVFYEPGYEHWLKYKGEYNGFWSEINSNYSRMIFPYRKPSSLIQLPSKPGIYMLDTSRNTLKSVENTNKEGIYYFSKYWNGVDKKISVNELFSKRFDNSIHVF